MNGNGHWDRMTSTPPPHFDQYTLDPPPAPGFYSYGSELQRYQHPLLTPPSYEVGPSNMAQDELMIQETVSLRKELLVTRHRNERTAHDLQEVKEAARNDIQKMHGIVKELQGRMEEMSGNSQLTLRGKTDQRVGMRIQSQQGRSRKAMAEACLAEAEEQEAIAKGMRARAEELCPGMTWENDPWNEEITTPTHVPPRRVKSNAEILQAKVPESEWSEMPDIQSLKVADAVQEAPVNVVIEVAKDVTPTPEPKIWQPLVVRQMPDVDFVVPEDHKQTFTWDFLQQMFSGEQWSPGFYVAAKPLHGMPGGPRSYWLLEGGFEPGIPSGPGKHGAKLTAFFNESVAARLAPGEEDYVNVPVFVRSKDQEEYVYYGNYNQNRFSDKLDLDRLNEQVPEHVRKYWASVLADPDRPEWVTDALIQHFWPKPEYEGPLPTDSAFNAPATEVTGVQANNGSNVEKRVVRALADYAYVLKDWARDARMKVNLLTPENLMKAFDKADADDEPSLRLWWEYLECVEYNQTVYNRLVGAKEALKEIAVNRPIFDACKPEWDTMAQVERAEKSLLEMAIVTGEMGSKETATANGDLKTAKRLNEEPKASGSRYDRLVPPHRRNR